MPVEIKVKKYRSWSYGCELKGTYKRIGRKAYRT